MYCIKCHVHESLPAGQKLWVCALCNEYLALREQVHSLEAKVADLEKLREAERLIDETFRDLTVMSHCLGDSSSAVTENLGLEEGGRHSEEEGNDLLEGTHSSGEVQISSSTKDMPTGGGGL